MNTKTLVKFATKPKVVTTSVATLSFVLGAATSYFVLNTRLSNKYEALAEEEIAKARQYYSAINKTEKFATPESAVQALIGDQKRVVEEIINKGDYRPSDSKHDDDISQKDSIEKSLTIGAEEDVESVEVVTNVFATSTPASQDDFDYVAEVALRTEETPYVITHDEYFEGETNYAQTSLTYFDGDGILTDDRDHQVDEVESVVGHDNLEKFGYGSKDANIVYIRNDRMTIDIEVTRSTGKYTEEVLGYIEHSDKRQNRKFRRDDE